MITVQKISNDDFASMEQDWNALVADSIANPLFMGWAWLYSWWEVWSAELDLELYILAAYKDDRIIGILPMYKHKNSQRLEFIGSSWRKADTVRTEYCSCIVTKQVDQKIIEGMFVDYIFSRYPKTDVILADVSNSTLVEAFERADCKAIKRDTSKGAKISLAATTFETYLSELSASVRRRLFHRRKYLKSHYDRVEVTYLSSEDENLSNFFMLLNQFHNARWGKSCFENSSLKFHLLLIERLKQQATADVILSVIYVDDQPISVVYDIKVGNKIFNIQSGYIENFSRQISLGLLHLGYQIERAFSDTALEYDFLLGDGKHSFYKSKLTDEIYQQHTYHIVTNRLKIMVLSIYYNMPLAVRDSISSVRQLFKI